jgi:hypothetical protein
LAEEWEEEWKREEKRPLDEVSGGGAKGDSLPKMNRLVHADIHIIIDTIARLSLHIF